MEVILDNLNDEQRSAAVSSAKYLQISAGPGTGKTSTLAARVFNLQYEYDLNQNNIIAISFSRSAKQQLIQKMNSYTEILGYGSIIEILTFHSLAHRIVRFGSHSGESAFKQGFQTINTEDFIRIKPSILNGLCPQYADRDHVGIALAKGLNSFRQGGLLNIGICNDWTNIDPSRTFKIDIDAGERIIVEGKDLVRFWKHIKSIETNKNVIDFQGLITESNRLLSKKGETYNMVSKDLEHILVDEYQDSSLSQEQLLFSFAGSEKNIAVVGDKNQSIYAFNGSNSENIDRFYDKFNEIAPKQTERIYLEKNYRSTKGIVGLSNDFVGTRYIESAKDPFDYLCKPIVVNTQSLELAATYIASEIQDLKHNQNISYNDICILYRKNSEYYPQASEVIKELDMYQIPWKNPSFINKEEVNVKEDLMGICDEYPGTELGEILEIIKRSPNNEGILVEIINDAISQGAIDTDDLIDYIIDMDVSVTDDVTEAITLSTVHAAKGKEYPVVFVLYLGDRHFPHGSQPDIEEERRLLYVAITRAMNQLYILGKNGIQQEDFLGKCMSSSEVELKHFHSRYEEEKIAGFSTEDLIVINETSRKLEIENVKKIKRIVDSMENW